MSSNPEVTSILLKFIPWNHENQAIWMGTSLTLRRNLNRYNFPSKMQKIEVEQVLQTLKKSLLEESGLEQPHFFAMNTLSATDRELMFEHFLFLRGLTEPPNGSGAVIDDKGTFLALLNTGNHLELRTLNTSNQMESAWNSLAQIENRISAKEGFAFTPKFGFLTSDPSQCGTGLTVNAYLHLPALIHTNQIDSAIANAEDDEIQVTGMSSEDEEFIGDLVILQNNYSIGMTEEAIIHAIQIAATKLIGAEKTMRQHLHQEQNNEIKDLVSKAYGLMLHSFQLETKDALDLLSLLKLGVALGYISGVTDQTLSDLFFKCRRGYFSHLFPNLTDPKEINQKRADFLQQELKGITLL
ncbi:MAG: protein arginine kinase [Verrucomicrobia bacterium]|nr:protein arginine kinase [Verrucomicrobiota bacterium]